jgi:hypothetical protein
MSRKLTITLTDNEEAMLGGWVNVGLHDAAFRAHPYKVVLIEQTAARFDEVAAQFPELLPAPPVEPPPSGMVPVDVGPAISSTPAHLNYVPGRAQALPAEIGGNGSASVEEGGAGLYACVLSAPLPAAIPLSSFTTWGAKAVFGLALSPGQYLVVYSQAETALAGRADVR